MAKKKKQDIGEAIKRFREGPQMPRPKPPAPKAPEPPKDYMDSPGMQSPERRKKTQYRPKRSADLA